MSIITLYTLAKDPLPMVSMILKSLNDIIIYYKRVNQFAWAASKRIQLMKKEKLSINNATINTTTINAVQDYFCLNFAGWVLVQLLND